MLKIPIELILNHLIKFNYKTTASNDTLKLVEILETISVDSGVDSKAILDLLDRIQTLLEIPKSCIIEEDEITPLQLLEKERYLNQSPSLLSLAFSLIRFLPDSTSRPSTDDLIPRVKFLLFFGRFTDIFHTEGFVSSRSQEISTNIANSLLTKTYRYPIIHYILTETFPPLFKPHPKLNPETGRVLSRPRGGERGLLDWYEESEVRESWRNEDGLGNVLKVIIRNLEKNEVEELWPLLLPPLLAYLDDYEAGNKIIGTSILACLLQKVDHSLLRRTGVGLIFEQSLASCFSTLTSPHTPSLLRSAHSTSRILLPLLHPPANPADTFEAWCALLTNGIIQIWEFKSNQSLLLELILLENLKPIMIGLEGGSIRYLNILIPRLSSTITGDSLSALNFPSDSETVGKKMEVQILAIENLIILIRLSGERIKRWKGIILGSVGKCWQGLVEEEVNKKEVDKVVKIRLEMSLREVISTLEEITGDEFKIDSKSFEKLDPMFSDLVKQDS